MAAAAAKKKGAKTKATKITKEVAANAAKRKPVDEEVRKKPSEREAGKVASGKDGKKAAKPTAKRKAKAKVSDKSAGKSAEKKEKPGRGKKRTMAKRLQEAQDVVEKDGENAAAEAVDEQPRGVIYLAHIPAGFFEPQMRKFFSQFGQVTRLRLSRSKKNGALKGFGWIEFIEEDVAKIVQQTMEGYLLFGKKMKCELVPKEKQHPALFKGCKKRMVNRQGARRSQFKQAYNNRPTAEVDGELVPRQTVRQYARKGKTNKKLSDKLASLGVTFDLEAVLDGAGEGDDLDLDASKPGRGTKRQAGASSGTEAKKQKKKTQK